MARTPTSAPSEKPGGYAVVRGPSLGWGILDWIAKYLPSPADESKPFILTDEQAWLVLRWYAVDADTGEFLHRRAELEMAKGWGKSPLVAAIALAEFCGPVLFDHWDEHGQPVGRPWYNPWVQIAAVSEDQTDNTYHALYEMLAANDHRAAKALGIDDGRTRLYLKGRPGVLEPVTASSGSREGQRLTFAVLDETHLWTRRNGGTKLAGTLRRNAAKMGGRTFETTNAPVPGENSVAEQSGLAPGVLYRANRPSRVPESDWTDEQLTAALREVYGDSWWVSLPRLLAEIHDPATDWDDALRFYFNVRTAGQGRAVDPVRFDLLASRTQIGPPPAGTRIGLGFDGSNSGDSSALRGCTRDGYHFTVHIWERPRGDDLIRWQNEHPGVEWQVPRADVESEIARAFGTWSVGRFFYDPPLWRTEGQGWQAKYNPAEGEPIVLELDTYSAKRMGPAVDRWRTDIKEGRYSHDADPLATAHIKAAHLQRFRSTSEDGSPHTLYRLAKGDDGAKIDGATADVLANEAAATMPEATAKTQESFFAWA